MGFGYHDENMKLLNLQPNKKRHVYGSILGFNQNEKKIISNKYLFINKLDPSMNLDFIRNYLNLG